jgi:hypothetical protein
MTFMTAVNYNDSNSIEVLDHFRLIDKKIWTIFAVELIFITFITFLMKKFGQCIETNIDIILLKLLLLKRKFEFFLMKISENVKYKKKIKYSKKASAILGEL